MSEPSCPSCGVLTGSSQLRLVVDTCGHQKCRRCLLQEETGCAQCRAQRCSVIVRLDSQEGLEQQLENIYLSDHGEEEEEEEDAASIQSDINAELLLGVRGDIVQHWVEDNHFEESEELIEELQKTNMDTSILECNVLIATKQKSELTLAAKTLQAILQKNSGYIPALVAMGLCKFLQNSSSDARNYLK